MEETRQEFEHIHSSFWFVIVSLTTVGYGDIIPYTHLGRLVAVFIFV